MNSRERLQLALNHREADRVPFDLGATVLTSIHHKSYRGLRKYLGMADVEPRIVDIFQQIVTVDDDKRERLRVDVRDVAPRSSAAFRIEIKEESGYTYFYDEWGIGWRMPKEGGWYYDMFDHPLKDSQSIAEIENYNWPDPVDPARFVGMGDRANHAATLEQHGVFIGGLCAGIMEMAAWMRGFANYFSDFANNEKRLVALMRKVMEP